MQPWSQMDLNLALAPTRTNAAPLPARSYCSSAANQILMQPCCQLDPIAYIYVH